MRPTVKYNSILVKLVKRKNPTYNSYRWYKLRNDYNEIIDLIFDTDIFVKYECCVCNAKIIDTSSCFDIGWNWLDIHATSHVKDSNLLPFL